MPERKVWTQQEDQILKHLIQERRQKKWATIARLMEQEFNIQGRTGKQCRQRYHNHLDSSIVNTEWTPEEEEILYNIHLDIGNKWSIISQKLPGRSDNCVKNHFYSKLRKATRKLNKIISDNFHKEYNVIKSGVLSQIIETTQSKFKMNTKIDEQLAEFCTCIKNRLFKYEIVDLENPSSQQLFNSKQIIEDIEKIQRKRKNHKKTKKQQQVETQYKNYLKPPPMLIKRQNSTGSEFSDDGSSFISSCSFISSDPSDYDNQYDNNQKKLFSSTASPRSPRSPRSFIGSFGNISDPVKQQGQQEGENKVYYRQKENGMVAQQFERQHVNLITVEVDDSANQYHPESSCQNYHSLYYDTPFMTRIIMPMDEQFEHQLFINIKNSPEEEDIQYKQQKSQ